MNGLFCKLEFGVDSIELRSSAVAGATAMMHSAVLPLTIFYIAANVAGFEGVAFPALLVPLDLADV